jgi:hypothetical protein
MDKSGKIRRYRRKNYTGDVEFPVEIIGRDGVVRRYSFEESIRLYQRRIASADLRYHDRELIAAEKQHCLHRIEQLRRSFFARYGWPAVQIVDEGSGPPGMLAAEVAAFLRRCLSAVDPQPERFSFSKLEATEHYRVYFVQPPSDDGAFDAPVEGHFLLYVFQFDVGGGSPEREAFFELIKVLDGVSIGSHLSVESLVAFFHTHDCGLVLTGSGNVVQQARNLGSEVVEELSWADGPAPPDPVEKGMRLLAHGKFQDALDQFVLGYTQQHFRRVAYLGAAVVADQLGQDDEAETATVMGCQYFPGDPALKYHRAVNQIRRGAYSAAIEELRDIAEWPHGQAAVSLLNGLCLLATGQHSAGRRHVFKVIDDVFHLDPHLARGARWVRAQIWARDLMLCAVAVVGLLALVGTVIKSVWCIAALPFAVAAWKKVMASWRRQLVQQLQGDPDERIRLSSSAILISGGGAEALQ